MEITDSFDTQSKDTLARALYLRRLLEEIIALSTASELDRLRALELIADLWDELTKGEAPPVELGGDG